jgi:hypothetical protein
MYLHALEVALAANRFALPDDPSTKREARRWLALAIEMATEDYPVE